MPDPARVPAIRERQSCRHLGVVFLRERGQKAGRASARARRKRIADRARQCHTKAEAFIRGYERGYRAAYKRHYDYWRRRSAAA